MARVTWSSSDAAGADPDGLPVAVGTTDTFGTFASIGPAQKENPRTRHERASLTVGRGRASRPYKILRMERVRG